VSFENHDFPLPAAVRQTKSQALAAGKTTDGYLDLLVINFAGQSEFF
jgi:hypothetical protein